MAARSVYLSVVFNGVTLTNVLAVTCSFGFDRRVAEATIVVPTVPGSGTYNDAVTIGLGAGSHNVTRFVGILRQFDYSLAPRAVALQCKGSLVKALDYQNYEDPAFDGGLTLQSLLGTDGGTDQAIVKAVLTKAGVSYTAGNIGGTGTTLGKTDVNDEEFIWRAGSTGADDPLSVGESALDYIERIDRISAVYTNATSATGFYRTFETLGGVVYRSLIGGRPRTTADATFTEGTDIYRGQSSREYPLGNYLLITGYDPGDGSGAEQATVSASNALQPGPALFPYAFSSPMIGKSLAADSTPTTGMACDTVGNALAAEISRETVRVRFTTPRDDYLGPGATVLVQGPGGAADRLGVGEKLWIQAITVRVDQEGFSQDLECIGGGSPDAYLPAVPQ